MTRLRRVLVLLACLLVVGVLAGVSVLDPFHLRHAAWYTAGLVAVGLVLLTAVFGVAAPRGVLRWLGVLLGLILLGGWAFVVWTASTFTRDNAVVAEVDQAGRRLVTLEGSAFAVDPVYAVVLRAGGGPFEQESLVYQGLEEAPRPTARFVDDRTVEVRVGTACVYRSAVEDVTLDVSPVHRPIVLGC